MERSEFKRRLDTLDYLPILPHALSKALTAFFIDHDPHALVDALRLDPGLFACVIKAGAAPWDAARQAAGSGTRFSTPLAEYGVRNLNDAMIGRSLMGSSLSYVLREKASPSKHATALAQRALAKALAAEHVARRSGKVSSREAYSAALVADIGALALCAIQPESWVRVEEPHGDEQADLFERERREFGIDHTRAGKWLAELWRFPETLADVIWLHHHPSVALESAQVPVALIDTIKLAGYIASAMVEVGGAPAWDTPEAEALLLRAGLARSGAAGCYEAVAAAFSDRTGLSPASGEDARGIDAALKAVLPHLLDVHTRAEAERLNASRSAAKLRAFRALHEELRPGQSIDEVLSVFSRTLQRDLTLAPGLCCAVDAGQRCLYVRTWRTTEDRLGSLTVNLEELREGHASQEALPEGGAAALAAVKELGLGKSEHEWAGARVLDVSRRSGLVAVPMIAEGRSVGQIILDADASGRPVDETTMADLIDLASLCGRAITRQHAEESAAQRSEQIISSLRDIREIPRLDAPHAGKGDVSMFALKAGEALQSAAGIVSTQGQRLLCRTENPEQAGILDMIVRQGRYMNRVVSDLVAFGRQTEPRLECHRLNLLLHQLVLTIQTRLERKGIRVTEIYADDMPSVEFDREQVERVFLQLFSNAEQAMDGGGALTVQAYHDPHTGLVTVCISDTGPGMKHEHLAHLFEPFYKADPSSQGTGLGLAVAKAFVERQGGRIHVESALGKGATFVVAFPAASNHAVPVEEHAGPDGQVLPAMPAAPRTVLVVDDDEGVREILRQALEMQGYGVRTACDGVEALEELQFNGVDLIVLDIRMPRRDGFSVLSELQTHSAPPPVIVMTGSKAPEDIEEALRKGARTCLQKPFELRVLLSEIESAVDAAPK